MQVCQRNAMRNRENEPIGYGRAFSKHEYREIMLFVKGRNQTGSVVSRCASILRSGLWVIVQPDFSL